MKRLCILTTISFLSISLWAADQAILMGQLNEVDLEEVYLETIATVALDEPEKTAIKVNPDRSFKVTLALPPSQQFKLKIGALTLPLFLEAGDSLLISLETANEQLAVKFAGRGSANNTFLFQYTIFEKKLDYGELETALQGKDASAYWEAVQKINKVKQGYFEQYVERSRKPLSDSFKALIDHQIKYKLVDELLTFWVYYRAMIGLKMVDLPSHYANYLKNIKLTDDEAIHSSSYQSALLNWITLKNKGAYGQFVEDELKRAADRYKIAGEELEGASQYFAQYVILRGLLKADHVYAAYEYEDYMKGAAPSFLKDPLSRLYQIKSMKLDGLPMPDLKLVDQQGNTKKLSDFKGKIQYICLWKNDGNTDTELSNYFRLFGRKVTQDSLVKFQLIYVAGNEKVWDQVLKKQKRPLPFMNHYRLDLSDELTSSFVLRTDNYGPMFIVVDKKGVVTKDNASMSYELNPNTLIRRMLKADRK